MEKNKYLFICSTYPEDLDSFFLKLSGKDSTTSGNIHSLSIIKALNNLGYKNFVISGASIGHYPLNSHVKKVPSVKVSDSFFCVGYNNHFLVSQQSKAKAIYKCFKKYCNDRSSNINILLADIHEPFARAALKIKRLNPNARIVNICLDVPDTIKSSNETKLRRFLKSISVKRNNKLLTKMDGFVVLSKEMIERLPINGKPVLVSPCLAESNLYSDFKKQIDEKIKVVYCGVLSRQYNADFLLDAFSKIEDERFELYLAGKGDAVELIKEKCQINNRIHYLGELSRKDALQLQLNANVLVNPRLPENTYTSFSFPSKTISYLLSNNPVVCYTFSSFPNEIKKMVFEPKATTPESLAEAIIEASTKKSKADFSVLKKYSPEEFINKIDKLFAIIRNDEEKNCILSIE